MAWHNGCAVLNEYDPATVGRDRADFQVPAKGVCGIPTQVLGGKDSSHLYRESNTPAHRLQYASQNTRLTLMVWVNPYFRVRFGHVEFVSGHFRSSPRY